MWQNPFQTEGERRLRVEALLEKTTDGRERDVLECVLVDKRGLIHVHEDGRIQHVKWLIKQQ